MLIRNRLIAVLSLGFAITAITSVAAQAGQDQTDLQVLNAKSDSENSSEAKDCEKIVLSTLQSTPGTVQIGLPRTATTFFVNNSELYQRSRHWWRNVEISDSLTSQNCSFRLFDPQAKGLFADFQSPVDVVAEGGPLAEITLSVADQVGQLPPIASPTVEQEAAVNFAARDAMGSDNEVVKIDVEPLFENIAERSVLEPYLVVDESWEAALRSSQSNDDFVGPMLMGRAVAGFGSQNFRRVGIGLDWTPNPGLKARLEFGQDWFDRKGSSGLTQSIENKNYVGLEIVSSF